MITLADAQRWLADRVTAGARCPCCNQFTKVYRRRINSGMARSLIAMYRHGPDGQWVHLPTQVGARSREEGKLRYWGLVEEQISVHRVDGGRAGYWRLTDAGRAWVTGRSTVAKYAAVYNNIVLDRFGPQVSITDTLGARFDYAELMRPASDGNAMTNEQHDPAQPTSELPTSEQPGCEQRFAVDDQDPSNSNIDDLVAPLDPDDDVFALVNQDQGDLLETAPVGDQPQ